MGSLHSALGIRKVGYYIDVIREPTILEARDSFANRERKILEFERYWWKYAGAKERAIRQQFSMSATRYYQLLNTIIDMPEALSYDPILVKRLQRLRAFRQRQRVANRLGVQVTENKTP